MRLQVFLKYLTNQGCEVTPTKSGYKVTNPANGHIASFHRANPVSDGVVKSVCRDLGIPSPLAQDEVVQQGSTTITYHTNDVLPDIKYAAAENAEQNLVAYHMDADVADAADISGCVALIGPVQICYSADLTDLVFDLSLKVGPITVASAEISAAKPCVTLNGSYKVAKWDLEICLNLQEKSITLSGKACLLFSCKSFNITIFKW